MFAILFAFVVPFMYLGNGAWAALPITMPAIAIGALVTTVAYAATRPPWNAIILLASLVFGSFLLYRAPAAFAVAGPSWIMSTMAGSIIGARCKARLDRRKTGP